MINVKSIWLILTILMYCSAEGMSQNIYFENRFENHSDSITADLCMGSIALDTGGYISYGSFEYFYSNERYGSFARVDKYGNVLQRNYFGWLNSSIDLHALHETSSGDYLAVGNYIDLDSFNRFRPIIASINPVTLDTNWTKIIYHSSDTSFISFFSRIKNDSIALSGRLNKLDSAGNINESDADLLVIDISGTILNEIKWGIQNETESFGEFDYTIDGGFIISTAATGYGTYLRSLYIKMDDEFNVEWIRPEGPSDAITRGGGVLNTQDGHIIIYHDEAQEPGVSLVERRTRVKKLTYNNTVVWSKLIDPLDVSFTSVEMIENPDSTLILSRQFYWNLIAKLTKNGDVLWERARKIGPDAHVVGGVIHGNNEGYLLSGFYQPLGGTQSNNQDTYLIKTNCMGFASPPVANAIVGTADNFEVIVDNNSQYYDYAIWQWGDGTIDTTYNNEDRWGYTPDTLVSHTYGSAGVYNLTLIAGACGDVDTLQLSANAAISGTVDIEKEDFKIYPVPASDHINVQFERPTPDGSVSIFDLTGQCLKVLPVQTEILNVDVSDLSKGTYMLVYRNEGIYTSRSFIVW